MFHYCISFPIALIGELFYIYIFIIYYFFFSPIFLSVFMYASLNSSGRLRLDAHLLLIKYLMLAFLLSTQKINYLSKNKIKKLFSVVTKYRNSRPFSILVVCKTLRGFQFCSDVSQSIQTISGIL